MAWEIELHDDVTHWLRSLDDAHFRIAERNIDRLAEAGPLFGEPQTRRLRGKLGELRFQLYERQVRITYFIASGGTIVLLTVFFRTRMQERAQMERAEAAMQQCLREHRTNEEAV